MGSLIIPKGSSPCIWCKHLRGEPIGSCDAYPEGIPDAIYEGENNHTKPYKGDHGIQFQQVGPDMALSNIIPFKQKE